MPLIYFSGYWSNHNPNDSTLNNIFSTFASRVNLHSAQVFGKRGSMFNNISSTPSLFYSATHPEKWTPQVLGDLPTFSFLQNGENPMVNLYLFNSLDNYAPYVDLCLGPYDPREIPTEFNNYLKFPYWTNVIQQKIGTCSLDRLQQWVEKLEAKRRENPFKRQYIACLVASHDDINYFKGVRKLILEDYEQIIHNQHVFCGGKFNKNTDMLAEECGNDKNKFLEQFVFNLCPENTYTRGYVTEKILDAYTAGCIPIYWGGIEDELDIFNQHAMIYYDPHQRKSFRDRLEELAHGGEKVDELVAQPVFMPGAAARIYLRYFYPLYCRLLAMHKARFRLLHHPNWNIGRLPSEHNLHQDAIRARQILRELHPERKFDLQGSQLHLLMPENNWPFTSQQRKQLNDYLARVQHFEQHERANYEEQCATKDLETIQQDSKLATDL